MRRSLSPLALCAALACAGERPATLARLDPAAEPSLLLAAELARVRCVLVAPFENGSDAPLAADAVTAALAGALDPARTGVYPIAELRAVFQGTPLELPAGFGPSLAHELAGIVGADAALSGAVEGRTRGLGPELLVSIRLALPANHELLFARTVVVRPDRGEPLEDALRREVLAAARPMLAGLGDGGTRRCFDPERARVLRGLALAQARPPPAPAPPTTAPPAAWSPRAAPAADRPTPRTPRQADWARRLAAGERIVLEDVVFSGRTAELQRDAGLVDVVVAFGDTRGGALRLEAFVDATSDPAADQRLSAAMVEAAAQRLVGLGVPRARIALAGRGGDAPLLPNFTARGRAANRRLEAVVAR